MKMLIENEKSKKYPKVDIRVNITDDELEREESLKKDSILWWRHFKDSEVVPLLQLKFNHSDSCRIVKALGMLMEIKYGRGYYNYYEESDYRRIRADVSMLLEDWYYIGRELLEI